MLGSDSSSKNSSPESSPRDGGGERSAQRTGEQAAGELPVWLDALTLLVPLLVAAITEEVGWLLCCTRRPTLLARRFASGSTYSPWTTSAVTVGLPEVHLVSGTILLCHPQSLNTRLQGPAL